MNNTKAIFVKQMQSLIRNPGLIVQGIIFLIIALAFSFLLGLIDNEPCDDCITAYVCEVCAENDPFANTPDPSLPGLFAMVFVGLALVGSSSAMVLEDKKTQNLRFMVMAGMKPHQYLPGTAAALFIVTFVIILLFSISGGYFGMQMVRFVGITMFGALVSTLLGIALGLNKYPVIATPISILLGFGPMLSTFNQTLARYLRFLYTQQINLAVSDLDADLTSNFAIIGINGLVVFALFVWIHRKGELRW